MVSKQFVIMERFLHILKEKETAVESVCVKISKQEASSIFIYLGFFQLSGTEAEDQHKNY